MHTKCFKSKYCHALGVLNVAIYSAEKHIRFSHTKGYFDFPLMPKRRAFMFGKTFFMIFRNQLRLKDGSPDCRNNSWNTAWETDEYKQTQPLSITGELNHSLVFIVHLLFWQWGFRVLFQVISDPVERVHLLSPAGRHGVLVAIGKTEEKKDLKQWWCTTRKLCVRLLVLYNISCYILLQNNFPFNIVKVVVPYRRTCRAPLIFSSIGHHVGKEGLTLWTDKGKQMIKHRKLGIAMSLIYTKSIWMVKWLAWMNYESMWSWQQMQN